MLGASWYNRDDTAVTTSSMKNLTVIITILLIAVFGFGLYLVMGPSTSDEAQVVDTEDRSETAITTNNESAMDDTSVTLAEGVISQTLAEGSGDPIQAGNVAVVHYTGTLEDGTKFDSSLDKGQPFSFTLGGGSVIKGWDIGVEGMKVGEKRKLTIPGSAAYGEAGYPGVIPPNATLIFEVELVGIR